MLDILNFRSIHPIPLSLSHPNSQNTQLGMSIMLCEQKFTDHHFNFEHGAEDLFKLQLLCTVHQAF
jgi:hypothetical protein